MCFLKFFRAASSSGIKVKSEPSDNGDCVITSAVFKGEKSSMIGTGSLGVGIVLFENLDVSNIRTVL